MASAAAAAPDSGWAGLSRLQLIQQAFAALHSGCWSYGHVFEGGREEKSLCSIIATWDGWSEKDIAEQRKRGEPSAHPASDSWVTDSAGPHSHVTLSKRTTGCTTIRDVIHWMILIWDGSDDTADLCFPPAGWRALLLPRPGEREGGLPRGRVYLQRPAVSQRSPLTLAVWTVCAETSTPAPTDSVSTAFSPLCTSLSSGSGMFDDGVHMYLIEPLRQTHSAVSCSTKASPTSALQSWLICT